MESEEYKQAVVDEEQLKWLPMLYWISGGLTLLFSLYFLAYVGLGFLVAFSPPSSDSSAPPASIGWFFGAIGVIGFTLLVTGGVLKILSGFWVRRRRHRITVMVVAGISCLEVPYGTLLGILTFLVLSRSSVAAQFGVNRVAGEGPAVPLVDGDTPVAESRRKTALPALVWGAILVVLLVLVVGGAIFALDIPDRFVLRDLAHAAELMEAVSGESTSRYRARVSASAEVAQYVDVRTLERNIERRLASTASTGTNAPYAALHFPREHLNTAVVEWEMFRSAPRMPAWTEPSSDAEVVRRSDGTAVVTSVLSWSSVDHPSGVEYTLTWVLAKRGKRWVVIDMY